MFYQQKLVASTKLKFLIKEKHLYEHIKKQNIFETNLKLVKKNCHKNKMDSWVIENFLSSKLLTIMKGWAIAIFPSFKFNLSMWMDR